MHGRGEGSAGRNEEDAKLKEEQRRGAKFDLDSGQERWRWGGWWRELDRQGEREGGRRTAVY